MNIIRNAATSVAVIVALWVTWWLLWAAAPAQAAELYADGTCTDEGVGGFYTVDLICVTPAVYDALFSYDALENVESQNFPGRSVADVYGYVPGVAASDRLLGVGLVASPSSFRQLTSGLVML